MLVAVTSVKGSPGTTTVAVALAALWPPDAGQAVMVEADCAGGDVAGRCWLPVSPGLAGLSTAARGGVVTLNEFAVRLPCGAGVVAAPTQRQPATVAVGLLVEAGPERWAKESTAIVDVGRLDPGTPAVELAVGADVLLLCSRGDEASLSRLLTGVPHAAATEVLVVGSTRYSPSEIERALGLPVTVLPWDERGVRALWGQARPSTAWARRGLPEAARGLARRLAHRSSPNGPLAIAPVQVSAHEPARRPREGMQAWVRSTPGSLT